MWNITVVLGITMASKKRPRGKKLVRSESASWMRPQLPPVISQCARRPAKPREKNTVESIAKLSLGAMQGDVSPTYGYLWYSTSILGSWNSMKFPLMRTKVCNLYILYIHIYIFGSQPQKDTKVMNHYFSDILWAYIFLEVAISIAWLVPHTVWHDIIPSPW